jgi:hypothetical protein
MKAIYLAGGSLVVAAAGDKKPRATEETTASRPWPWLRGLCAGLSGAKRGRLRSPPSTNGSR